MAKSCPKCGHPVDEKGWIEKVSGAVSSVPEKLAEKESHLPQSDLKRGSGIYLVLFWILMCVSVFAMGADDSLSVLTMILSSAFICWAVYGRKKNEREF